MNAMTGSWLQRTLLVTVFVLLAVLAMFPFYALLLASLKPPTELLRYGLNLRLDFDVMNGNNYVYLFTTGKIYFTWFFNSVLITVLNTVLTLITCSMVGYGLAKYQFKGRNAVFVLVLAATSHR